MGEICSTWNIIASVLHNVIDDLARENVPRGTITQCFYVFVN